MATFSYNGTAKQLYVAKSLDTTIDAASVAGAINAAGSAASGHIYFEYKGAASVSRSDLIKLSNVNWAKAIRYDQMARGLAKQELILGADVNGGVPVAGQDYLLRFTFYEYGSQSFEDQYIKHAAVRATTGMTASVFYAEMLKSMELNFSREEVKLLSFSAVAAGVVYTYDSLTKIWKADGVVTTEAAAKAASLAKIVIEEVEQPYVLGLKSSEAVRFLVAPDTILVSGDELIWGTVTSVAPTTLVSNGKIAADMEYFYLGERGDQYRNVGFPYVLQATYLADPSIAYNFIEIDYFYDGEGGVDVQKSQKHITLIVPAVGADIEAKVALVNSIIADINTAAGITLVAALATV